MRRQLSRRPAVLRKPVVDCFGMSGDYQDIVGAERMLDDHHQINNTTLPPDNNFTLEIENFNVTAYLATILGPQRQPNEKVHIH